MDEKCDTVKMSDPGVHKSKLVGVSMLLLSVLLTASVAALIYLAVANGQGGYQAAENVNVEARVNVKSDGHQTQAKIEYSHGGHMAYYYGDDGSFEADDFKKGIHIVRNTNDGTCYVIPVGTNNTSENGIEDYLREIDGEDMEAFPLETEVLDGKITDVSFLSEKVHKECTNGYQWMAIVRSEQMEEGPGGTMIRSKRGVDGRSCGCGCCCWWCCWWWRCRSSGGSPGRDGSPGMA